MAIGYAITYQYFTSVNYLCLPLGFKYGLRITRCFYGHHRMVHIYLARYIPADKYTRTQEQSVSSWKMFNSSRTRISKMSRVLLI